MVALNKTNVIMNFELNSLDLADAATQKADAMIVLVPKAFMPGEGAMHGLIAVALKAGDLDTKCGKSLHVYRAPGVACTRVVLVSCEEGSARQVRQAVAAAVGIVKQPYMTSIVVLGVSLAALAGVLFAPTTARKIDSAASCCS